MPTNTPGTIRDEPEWENFLRRIREDRGSSWWLARDEMKDGDWRNLPPSFRPGSSKSLGRLLFHGAETWTKELCVESKGGGNKAKEWRVVTLDEVLGYPLSP